MCTYLYLARRHKGKLQAPVLRYWCLSTFLKIQQCYHTPFFSVVIISLLCFVTVLLLFVICVGNVVVKTSVSVGISVKCVFRTYRIYC